MAHFARMAFRLNDGNTSSCVVGKSTNAVNHEKGVIKKSFIQE